MPTVQPRLGFGRCTDFTIDNIVDLSNNDCVANGNGCSYTLKLNAIIYNSTGALTYNWSSDEGIDSGVHTNPEYALVVSGNNEVKTINVSLIVTDTTGNVTNTTPFVLQFGTP